MSGKHKERLISLITLMSVFGVALGVFALIVVLAVMDGFGQNLRDKMIGAYSHLEVTSNDPQSVTLDAAKVMPMIQTLPEVRAVAPTVRKMGLIEGKVKAGQQQVRMNSGCLVMGLDYSLEPSVSTIMTSVTGEARPGENGIVLGKELHDSQIPVESGARLTLLLPIFAETPNGRMPTIFNLNMAGMFDTGFPQTDAFVAYMDIKRARELFLMGENESDSVRVMLKDPDKVVDVQKKIEKLLGPSFKVTTWVSNNPQLFDAIQLEKWAMFIILLLIVVVAAANIVGSLVMVVMEKTREIGIMKSMGATRESIHSIFVRQGMLIGFTGTTLGATLGLTVCYLLKYHIKIDVMSKMYLGNSIPIVMDFWTNVVVVVSALVICFLASLYPARQAAKLDPVEALRYE